MIFHSAILKNKAGIKYLRLCFISVIQNYLTTTFVAVPPTRTT